MKRTITKLLVCALLISVAFITPLFRFDFDVSSIVTIASLLFTILVGFFIAAATSNYLTLQSLIANEDAGLIAIYNYCKVIAPEMLSKLVDIIDIYAIAALSFELTEYINCTQSEFDVLSKAVEDINFKDGKGEQLIQSLHEKKNELYNTRQNIALVARRIVTSSHWFVIGSLTLLLDLLVLSLRDGSTFSSIVTGVLLVVTYITLQLLFDIDNNHFLEQVFSYDNSQQVFKIIGKPRYYAESFIKNSRISKPKGTYRTGYYNSPVDNSIKLVEVS